MDTLKTYLIDRLDERSTWRGVVLVLTALGVTLSPEQAEAIIAAGIAGAGLIGVFAADKKA
jgi:hypothetical protein